MYCAQLCDLYENDCIFDKFDCCMNGSASYVASGSYSNTFKVFKCGEGAQGIPLEASRDPMRRRLQPAQKVKQVAYYWWLSLQSLMLLSAGVLV